MKHDDERIKSIEISADKDFITRLFEIIPGVLSWGFFVGLVVFSFLSPIAVAYVIIAYDIFWLIKSVGMIRRVIQAYFRLNYFDSIDWNEILNKLRATRPLEKVLEELSTLQEKVSSRPQKFAIQAIIDQLNQAKKDKVNIVSPDDIVNVAIIAVYNENEEVVASTLESVAKSDYPNDKLLVVIAYEERGGKTVEKYVKSLSSQYKKKFMDVIAVKHPKDLPGEVIGKGGNITYAGRVLNNYIEKKGIQKNNVIVTTLDADNQPAKNYFSYLTFVYITTKNRKYASYQPVPMFVNNIWDAPAPMRIIATSNSFWMLVQSMRPHLLRNFSAHAQSLDALVETDFWSTKTIVEDGHQYWRSFFAFDGNHDVVPLFVAVRQDAVLSKGYLRTFKAQFIQLRRWAWGVSDVAYVVRQSINNKQIPFFRKLVKLLRLMEGHISWATAPIVIAFVPWLPGFLSPTSDQDIVVLSLPVIASYIQTVATGGILVTIFLSFLMLPKRPERYKRGRTVVLLLQWFLLPLTSIFFSATAALTAQTRLMMGKYLEQFDVTEKHRVEKS